MAIYPNETVKTIMERRSIRRYKSQQISEHDLDCVIKCGLYAPSARNTQNWHFTVIQNAGLISRMNDAIKENMPPEAITLYKERQGGRDDFSVFYNVPTLVLISGDANDIFTDSNCGYAVQNMCLAAQSLGVASIIIGMASLLFSTSKASDYAKEFSIPDGYKPLYAVGFGYADMHAEAPERIEGKITYIK